MRLLIALSALLLCGAPQAQQIYKTVDANGNVIYTDQPPDDNAQPLDLPELMVVPAREVKPRITPGQEARPTQPTAEPYADLTLVEPEPEQTYWGTGGTLAVRLSTAEPLDPEHNVDFYLDGEKVGTAKSLVSMYSEVIRGQHQVAAKIVDGRGRELASVGPVTIYMKQQSVQNPNNPANRQRPSPRSGGG